MRSTQYNGQDSSLRLPRGAAILSLLMLLFTALASMAQRLPFV